MTDYAAALERLLPRTTGAEGAEAVARAARERVGRPAGWWGMLIFVASEATLFGAMIASYFYLRFYTVHWPPRGIPEPKVVLPLVLTGVLLLTSIPMQLAWHAARTAQVARAWVLILAAFAVQVAYLAVQAHEFSSDLDSFRPHANAYASIYYALLGTAHAHVFLGILFDVWLLGKLARGLTMYRLNATGAVVLYWHAVNAITLAVTLTIVSGAL
jgi:heme/copper-type cytochrome/quinol oxidase subunit 3